MVCFVILLYFIFRSVSTYGKNNAMIVAKMFYTLHIY